MHQVQRTTFLAYSFHFPLLFPQYVTYFYLLQKLYFLYIYNTILYLKKKQSFLLEELTKGHLSLVLAWFWSALDWIQEQSVSWLQSSRQDGADHQVMTRNL